MTKNVYDAIELLLADLSADELRHVQAAIDARLDTLPAPGLDEQDVQAADRMQDESPAPAPEQHEDQP
jgi:hypothetical protein